MRAEPGGAGRVRCVLESERQALPDGYRTTWVQIQVDGKAVRVSSASVLDPGEGDMGLAVDDGSFVRPDEVIGQKTAVFSSQYESLVN
jgi:hypothetical protein